MQESGRDQAHCMLGVGVLAELAECAWKQGDNLYAALDNRIMKGYEYLSKVNLGYTDVPFEVWKDATGKYCNWQNMEKQNWANSGLFLKLHIIIMWNEGELQCLIRKRC